jgi:mannan endo-1,4-beta-mannosidase
MKKWLLDSETNINNHELLKQKNLPIFFGETAPLNAGILIKTILDVISFRGLSVCAWIWKNDENDIDALLLQVYQMTKTTTIGDQLLKSEH